MRDMSWSRGNRKGRGDGRSLRNRRGRRDYAASRSVDALCVCQVILQQQSVTQICATPCASAGSVHYMAADK
jgi:hypothetical protein